MTISVPQARLILKAFMAGLRNNLAFADSITWNPHATEMNDTNGFVVSEQVGPEYTITESSGAVADLSTGVQDTVFGAQTFSLNKVFGLSMGASDIESIIDLQAARKSRALNNGIARLASRIDNHIGGVVANAFPWSTGTWGNTIIDPDEFSTARTRLAEASIESDVGLTSFLTHPDRQKLGKFIYNDAALANEATRAMRVGFAGSLLNIPQKATNMLGRITTGSRASAVINGAAQNVNYAAVADAGSNAGFYLTQTLNLTLGGGVAGAGQTVAEGEVFSIAGVNSWDADRGGSRGFAQQFVVVTGGTADASGNVTVRIFPAMVVGDGTSTTGTNGVNNAHRTVDAAPANSAVVTFLGAASTEYTPRVLFNKDSIVAHSAPLMMPYTGQGFRRSLQDAQRDNVAPLMPRLWLYSDPNTGAHKARIDVFVQAQPRNRWEGIKFFGA